MFPPSFSSPNGPSFEGMPRHARSTNRPIKPADSGKLLDFTVAGLTVPVTAFNELPVGFVVCLFNSSLGNITLKANGRSLIDGVSSGIVTPGLMVFLTRGEKQLHAYRAPGPTVIQLLTSGTSWVAPLGVRLPLVIGQGAGSGGQGGSAGTSVCGVCGDSGARFEALVPVLPGVAYAYSIGAGSAGGTTSLNNSSAAGNTTFTANGITYTAAGANGSGSLNPAVATNGTLNVNGEVAFPGSSPGAAGGCPFGSRGVVHGSGSNWALSTGYGCGGAGGLGSAGGGLAGQAGRDGVIQLTY